MIHKLLFLEKDRNTFKLIQSGKKNIETRAGNPEYFFIKAGDYIEFSCGDEKVVRKVRNILHYTTLNDLFAAYKPQEINPEVFSYEELRERYVSFPGYHDRLDRYGVLVFELE